MAADLSATTMLHIIDNLLPAKALQDLRDLCDIRGRLKEEHDGDAQFSWRPDTGSPRSIPQRLSKPSSTTTSTRPCSLWQHRSHPSEPESSGGATQTTGQPINWHKIES